MGDVLDETSYVALLNEARQALRDVHKQSEGISEKVNRAKDASGLALELISVMQCQHLKEECLRLKQVALLKRI